MRRMFAMLLLLDSLKMMYMEGSESRGAPVSSGFMGSSGGLNPIFGTEGVSQFGWEKNPVIPHI